jgi:hypothetical protein
MPRHVKWRILLGGRGTAPYSGLHVGLVPGNPPWERRIPRFKPVSSLVKLARPGLAGTSVGSYDFSLCDTDSKAEHVQVSR